jgi:hypothetical protein
MAEKNMAEMYQHVIAGFGDTPEAALTAAEARLPHPLKEAAKYSRHAVGDPFKVEGDQYKVEIGYDLPGATTEADKARKKSGSFGSTDPFGPTRDLDARLQ